MSLQAFPSLRKQPTFGCKERSKKQTDPFGTKVHFLTFYISVLKFWKVKNTFFRRLTQNRENSRLTTFYVVVGFYQAALLLCLIFTSEVNTVLSIFIHALRKFAIFSLFQGNIPFATSPVWFIFTHFQALRWAFVTMSWPHRGAKFAAFRTKNFKCPKIKGDGHA